MKIAVLLSGSGVYDGSEIHEAVSALIALDRLKVDVICTAPDRNQHHVINHLDGNEMDEIRNVLVESARIARGNILPLGNLKADDIDGLLLPGGFGAAKNLSTWAFDGPGSAVEGETKRIILEMHAARKPIAALCVSPVVLAKVLQEGGQGATLTLGTTEAASPYDIAGFHEGIAAVGADPVACDSGEIVVDETNRIISSPCYMMDASISQIYDGIEKACTRLVEMVGQ